MAAARAAPATSATAASSSASTVATAAAAAAATTPTPAASASFDARLAAVDALAEDLWNSIDDARATLHRERKALLQEFEAQRVQLHTEYSQKLLEADQELQEVTERNDFEVPTSRLNDVITLNVGGELFTVKRETLCVLRGSFMMLLFSGKYDSTFLRDAEGNVFLDFDPAVFELVLNWLRDKKIQGSSRLAALPVVPSEDLHHFQAIVDYLGLRPYLVSAEGTTVPGLTPDVWSVPDANRLSGDDGAEGAGENRDPSLMELAGNLFSSLRGVTAGA